jgi:hypothetical protein
LKIDSLTDFSSPMTSLRAFSHRSSTLRRKYSTTFSIDGTLVCAQMSAIGTALTARRAPPRTFWQIMRYCHSASLTFLRSSSAMSM